MNRSLHSASAASVIAVAALAPLPALAGVIEGRVSDQTESVSLEGATVRLAETGATTSTNRAGEYRFANVPAGQYTLIFSYVGAESTTVSLSVPSEDATVRQNISLGGDVAVIDNVLVIGQRGALNSALSQQKSSDKVITVLSSDAVGQLPDENVAEAARRAVGVNIQNDQGEGRYVSIRGANPNFVTTTVNGVRLPSPDSDQRQVPLDVIDSDILSSITITKSLTPDVDGDSIGGNVEITTLSGLDQKDLLFKLKAAGIYTNQVDEFGQRYSGAFADNFLDGRLGVAGTLAYQKRKFGSENKENDGEWILDEAVIYPEELELRDYQVTRKRFSAALNLDFQANDNLLLYAHGLYSDFSDQEYRSRVENKFGDPSFSDTSSGSVAVVDAGDDDPYEVDRDVKDRYEDQLIYSFIGGFEFAKDAVSFDASAAYSYAEESEPDRIDADFRAEFEGGLFGVDVSDTILPTLVFPDAAAEAAYYDPDNYEFDGVEHTNGIAKDKEYAFQTNLRVDVDMFGAPGYVKTGAKFRLREKSYDLDLAIYEADDLVLTDFATEVDYELDRINPVADPAAFRDFFFSNMDSFELDAVDTALESTGANYLANEDVYAGYVMGQRQFGGASVVAGVRMEHTEYDASGFNAYEPGAAVPAAAELIAEDDGDEVYRQAVDVSRSYTDWLPSINVRYDVTDEVVFRLGYYKTIVRPNLEAAAPRTLVDDDAEGEAGNPLLDRQKAHNFDASLEWYPGNKSILSAGVFYKDISDLITSTINEDVTVSGIFFEEVETYVNVPDASLFGVELNYQQPLDFLPGLLDGFIVGANYTYIDSEATLIDGREITIPGQSKHVATGILGYEKGPIDLRFAATYRDEYLDELSYQEDENGVDIDRIVDDHLQIDVSAKYRLTDQFRLFAEFKNVNDEPFVAFVRSPAYGKLNSQYEQYGWSAKFGVAFKY
ncbi:TonB-dependent receptor [Hyphococcus luteus]|uniref:TonB-dependent receptor n=1 Tax=Hyphococcus luteus TaxID=2058213 RepID=A0A2S7JZM4_9PROT|nr:TonB-dependent receptor [Marinicaulis flavus]PQA85703.1 TonB-dependent receptor [Marinicaulis flavus]